MAIFDCYNGNLTAGDIIMLQAIFAQMLQPLFFMGMLMKELDETRIHLQYAMDTFEKTEKLDKEESTKPLFVYNGGRIEFKNVWFGYHTLSEKSQKTSKSLEEKEKVIDITPEVDSTLKSDSTSSDTSSDTTLNKTESESETAPTAVTHHHKNQSKYILKDFNCVFEKGSKNAIVGYSGIGKTSIFNVIVTYTYIIIYYSLNYSKLRKGRFLLMIKTFTISTQNPVER